MSNKSSDLAAIYINEQPYNALYSLQEALCFGTIFPALYRPYSKNGR